MHDGAATTGTLVLVHDQCYGHRFSRPKTPKTTLSMIVERPERILASVLGISTAYVRLGDRHCDGNNPPHPARVPPERIPFKIRKTSRVVDLTSPVVTNVHGVKWMAELKDLCMDAGRKLAATAKELVREPAAPNEARKEEFHSGDLYLCSESLNAIQGALGGVLDAVDAVFQGTAMGTGPSRAFVCIRPPGHHCSDDHPSGFCWVNNVHVGIEHAIMQYDLTHAAIIDFDLHHGDGSQSITWARNKKVKEMSKNTPNKKKTSIGYFSLHDINSFPCEWGEDDKVQAASLCIDNAHGQSIWNIHLQPWTTSEEFWHLYEDRYLVLLEKTRKYLKHHTNRLRTSPNHPAPKAAIFLSAGFDASEWETEGMQRHGANVPTEFYARFTRDVVRLAEEEGTGVEGRVISVLEGGYSDRALTSGVFSHLSGLTDGQIWSDPPTPGRLAFDMRHRLGLGPREEEDIVEPSTPQLTAVSYDASWWDDAQLLDLETALDRPPMAIVKKQRTGPPPAYYSPTQSFSAKVVDPSKLYRSVSGKFVPASPSRAPTPPPPDVDWAIASHALSKLLIPSDRQTQSCKPEELAEPKVKKEKPAPVLSSVHVDPSGRQLRGRKAAPTYAEPTSDDEKAARAASRVNRRRTMAGLPTAAEEAPVPRPASRRMSIASSVGDGERSTSRASTVHGRRSVTPAASVASNGVPVKKARGTAATASRVPKNPPPVPRVPSGYLSKAPVISQKENDMDQLTSGLQRIKLKMPSKEEHEAREKEKGVEAAKKAPITTAAKTTRKAAAPRTKTTKAATTTVKKGPGRPAKVSKPASPVETPATNLPESEPVSLPVAAPFQPPEMTTEITATLEHPQLPSFEHPNPFKKMPTPTPPINVDESKRRSLSALVEPPTDLRGMTISPQDLPKPSFMTMVQPLPPILSPPREDTPPPPAPSIMPSFVNYTAQAFGTTAPWKGNAQDAPKQESQYFPAGMVEVAPMPGRPMSASAMRQDLPVFSSSGVIPFATNSNVAVGNTRTEEVSRNKVGNDIWEVPEAPQR